MKRILLGILIFFTLGSTAYAASQWGSYKGYPILRLTSNGQPLTVTDVPAMNFMDRTIVPVYLLRQIGLQVNYDAKTKTVDVKLPKQEPEGLSLAELNEIGKSVGIIYAFNGDKYISQGSGFVVDNTLITNWHVLEKATHFIVAFETKETKIQVNDALFKNVEADLMGFKLEGYPSLKLNTEEPENKDKVYALGYPHRKFTITEGIFIATWVGRGYQTTASIEGGSSGGCLINAEGEVIGVTASSVEENNWNYAIPAKVLQEELAK